MSSRTRLTSPVLRAACALVATALPAQNLALEVVGGSMPGPLELRLTGGYPFEIALIVPSSNPGPTPIGVFDPADPRSLSIGLDLVGQNRQRQQGGRANGPVSPDQSHRGLPEKLRHQPLNLSPGIRQRRVEILEIWPERAGQPLQRAIDHLQVRLRQCGDPPPDNIRKAVKMHYGLPG